MFNKAKIVKIFCSITTYLKRKLLFKKYREKYGEELRFANVWAEAKLFVDCWFEDDSYKRSFFAALLLHFLLLCIVFIHVVNSSSGAITGSMRPIHATVIMPHKVLFPRRQPQAKQQRSKLHQQVVERKVNVHRAKRQVAVLKKPQHKAAAAKNEQLLDKYLQQQLHSESQQLAAANDQRFALLVDKYKQQVVRAIANQWLVPSHVDKHLSCQLLVKVGPKGLVLDVKVLQSSGNQVLDRSARTAVLKAVPLPVPSDPKLFDKFRELRLTVHPEGVISETL